MTTPSHPVPSDDSGETHDPYTGEGAVPLSGDVDRHPYAATDFGITPRAINPEAFGMAPEAPTEGDPHASEQGSSSALPTALAGAGAVTAAAVGAALGKSRSSDDADDKREDKQDTRDSYTGEEQITTVRTTKKVRRPKGEGAGKASDIGIYVPLGFAVICLALLLAMFLFTMPGSWRAGLGLVVIVCAVLTVLTTMQLLATARRRRNAGEDMSHAIGLE